MPAFENQITYAPLIMALAKFDSKNVVKNDEFQ